MKLRPVNLGLLLFGFVASALPTAEAQRDFELDPQEIVKAWNYIDENETFIDSLLIQHQGRRVEEKYYRGYDETKLHDLQSATKTVTSLLIGIALEQGLIDSLDNALRDLLPYEEAWLEGAKAHLTVHHLLTMTSGLAWVDFGPNGSFFRIAEAEDSIAFILSEPMLTPPGKEFAYNTGSSHLLSAIIREVSGGSTAQFAEEHLFGPLKIENYEWATLKDGTHQGGWGLSLRPRAMIKLGQLILDEGRWDGQRLISQAYIDAATRQQTSTSMGSGYGYHMWIEKDLGAKDLAAARGWGGQEIFVLDELETVVVFTGDIRKPAEMARDVKKIMKDFIVPAHRPVRGQKP